MGAGNDGVITYDGYAAPKEEIMAARRRTNHVLKAYGSFVRVKREETDLNIAQLAKKLQVSASYVSQVEGGTTRCRRDFAERTDKALVARGEIVQKWDDLLKDATYPEYFIDFSFAEQTAALIRVYEAQRVYGPFQTEEYAKDLLRKDEAVQARLARLGMLDREDAPLLCVILDETVLYREVGSREVMRAQIEHLIELSRHDRVHLQIAPIAYYKGVVGSFIIATQPDRTEVLHEEKTVDGVTSTKSTDLAKANEAFMTLTTRALNLEDSRAFMKKVLEEKWT
jgi:transcriptional regulator with XRE-family HTH domain